MLYPEPRDVFPCDLIHSGASNWCVGFLDRPPHKAGLTSLPEEVALVVLAAGVWRSAPACVRPLRRTPTIAAHSPPAATVFPCCRGVRGQVVRLDPPGLNPIG